MATTVDDYSTAKVLFLKSDARLENLKRVIQSLHEPSGLGLGGPDALAASSAHLSQLVGEIAAANERDFQLQSLMGPFAHTVAKLLQSRDKEVVRNALSAMKSASCEEGMRRSMVRAGLMTHLVAVDVRGDVELLKEKLAVVQNATWDAETARDLAVVGGLRLLGEALAGVVDDVVGDTERGRVGGSSSSSAPSAPGFSSTGPSSTAASSTANAGSSSSSSAAAAATSPTTPGAGGPNKVRGRAAGDSEMNVLVLCGVGNSLAHCDGALSGQTHEMRAWVSLLVDACAAMQQRRFNELHYALSALANATRDPGLAHAVRAANGVDVLERCRLNGTDAKAVAAAQTALARLDYASSAKASDEPALFPWGRNARSSRGIQQLTSQQMAGMVVFLLAATLLAGVVVVLLFGFHSRVLSS